MRSKINKRMLWEAMTLQNALPVEILFAVGHVQQIAVAVSVPAFRQTACLPIFLLFFKISASHCARVLN